MTQVERETTKSPLITVPRTLSHWLRPNVPEIKTRSLETNLASIGRVILPTDVLRLSPSRPQVGDNHLMLCAPLIVETDPDQDYALFSSEYPDVIFPAVQVQFAPIKPGKSHLVEFHVDLFGGATYKFRKFMYPLDDYEDMSDDSTSVISVLVPPVPGLDSGFGAEIQQRNDPGEAAGWLLRYVRITAVD